MEKDYKLGELFSIRNGVNIKQTKIPEGVPITRIETISEGFVDLEKVGYASIKNDLYKDYYLQNGDILMSHINSELHLGKVAYVEDLPYPVIHGMNLLCLKIQRPNIFSKYLFYYFRTSSFKIQLRKIIKHSVNQASFRISDLSNIIVHVPEIEQQKRIVEILDICVSLLRKRQESIILLDELVNSVFNRLFGDPVKNDRKWECNPIGKYTDYIVPGRDKPKSFTGEIPWITTSDVKELSYITQSSNKVGLTLEEINEVRAKIIPVGSIIMTCVGDLGITSINEKEVVVNQQLHTYQCHKDVNNIFIMYALSFQKKYMYRMATTTTIPYMNKTTCNNIPIICPPLPLQNQFAEIVQKAEAIKQRFQKSLEELNHLYQSLSQRAFQGKLDLSRLDVEEELEKFQEKQQIKMQESVENMLLRDSAVYYEVPRVKEPTDKLSQSVSEFPLSENTAGREKGYRLFNIEQIAESIKKRYTGFHFSFEMLYRFLSRGLFLDVPYYSSEELKKRPSLNSEQDIRWFIHSAIVNVDRGENERRLLNPFIRLEQHFYNAEKENMTLRLVDEDYQLLRKRNKKERSGIYFSIKET